MNQPIQTPKGPQRPPQPPHEAPDAADAPNSKASWLPTRGIALLVLLVAGLLIMTPAVWSYTQPNPSATSLNTVQGGGNVELIGHIGGVTQAVFVQGNYAYIGVGARLMILDITNPASPTPLP